MGPRASREREPGEGSTDEESSPLIIKRASEITASTPTASTRERMTAKKKRGLRTGKSVRDHRQEGPEAQTRELQKEGRQNEKKKKKKKHKRQKKASRIQIDPHCTSTHECGHVCPASSKNSDVQRQEKKKKKKKKRKRRNASQRSRSVGDALELSPSDANQSQTRATFFFLFFV